MIYYDRTNNDELYIKYIHQHIKNVNNVWDKYREYFDSQDYPVDEIDILIVNHDASKFSLEEYEGYRLKFYPNKKDKIPQEDIDKIFASSVLQHYRNNPHHWNYWVYYDANEKENPVVLDMPDKFIVEMAIDWIAMGVNKENSNALDYYNENKDQIILSDTTRTKLETIFKDLFEGEESND